MRTPHPLVPVTCVGVLVRARCGRVLLVQTTKWRGAWGIPGGKVAWGETLEAAARRELREETGLTVARLSPAGVQEAVLSPEFGRPAHMLLHDFVGEGPGEAHDLPVTPNEEIVNWAWVTPQEAQAYPLNSFTRRLLERLKE